MDQLDNYKKYFFIAAAISVLVIAYAAFTFSGAFAESIQPGNRSFTVSGEAKVTAKNDIALFTYSVNIEGGKDISVVKKESNARTAKIQAFLKGQGINEKDITTISYNLEPRYQYYNCPVPAVGESARPCPAQQVIGYTLSQTDSVKIRDLAKADNVVSGVVDNGANNVSQLTFTVDDPSSLQTEAKGRAIKQAIDRAKQIADLAGFRIGRIISVDDSGQGGVVMPYRESLGVSKASPAADSAANLNPGSGDIISNVTVGFEIK